MEAPTGRINSLAYCFQEPLTAILRVRGKRQAVQDAEQFRNQMRRALQSAMNEARGLGYSSELVQLSVFATVAYLDESVLNLQNPAFAEWARRPLQEELFGGHTAGETFFRNLQDLLGRQDARDVADCLEVYCLCLLLGYKGRYAFGGAGEIQAYLRRVREKMARIRGNSRFMEGVPAPEVRRRKGPDRLSRGLGLVAAAAILLTLAAFGVFEFHLHGRAQEIQKSALNAR